MSKAEAQTPSQNGNTDKDNAKTLLHKCLSQFSRQQQIHGQQAVCYLRGKYDTMMSHTMVSMLSSLLFIYIPYIIVKKKTKKFDEASDSDSDSES